MFLVPDAPERFGIGQAMVAAMRFWLQAVGLVEEHHMHWGTSVSLTDFGRFIWQADPYLEQVETVWFLHLHLVKNHRFARVWSWFFNSFVSAQPFNFLMCLNALDRWAIVSYAEWGITRKSLHKDLACLLRMYDNTKQAKSPEESSSPFSRLHLLAYQQVCGQRLYHLLLTDPDHLSPLVLLYILLTKQVEVRRGIAQVSLINALYEPSNVGRVIPLLTRPTLLEGLISLREQALEWAVELTRHEGQDVLSLPSCLPEEVLARSYQKGR